MPVFRKTEHLMLKRARFEDGTPIRRDLPKPSQPAAPQVIVVKPDISGVEDAIRASKPEGMGGVIAAIRQLESKMPDDKLREYEFTVTERDENGKVLTFTVKETGHVEE